MKNVWSRVSVVLTIILAGWLWVAARSQGDEKKPPSATAQNAAAKPAGIVYLPKPSKAEMAILTALDASVQLQFVDTELNSVVDFLKDFAKVKIVIDTKALEASGIGTDSPVSLSVADVSLRSGLKLVLDGLELDWMIEDEVLKITTREAADARQTTRVYVVRDLLGTPVNRSELDDLTNVIISSVAAESWQQSGGPGSISPVASSGSLVIRQTRRNHEATLELLNNLLAAQPKEP